MRERYRSVRMSDAALTSRESGAGVRRTTTPRAPRDIKRLDRKQFRIGRIVALTGKNG